MKVFGIDSTAWTCLLLGLACIGCNGFSTTDSHGRTELCDVSPSLRNVHSWAQSKSNQIFCSKSAIEPKIYGICMVNLVIFTTIIKTGWKNHHIRSMSIWNKLHKLEGAQVEQMQTVADWFMFENGISNSLDQVVEMHLKIFIRISSLVLRPTLFHGLFRFGEK